MVALFVVLVFALFLVVDIVLHLLRRPALAEQLKNRLAASASGLPRIAGFRHDPDVAYHPGHAWARHLGHGMARIGLDDFALRLIGRPERITLPPVGTSIRANRPFATLERKGRRIRVLAPVSGVIAAVNSDVLAQPAALGDEPFGASWLIDIKSFELAFDFRPLLTGEMARRFLDEAAAALHGFFAPADLAPAMADGGEPVEGVGDLLDEAQWDRARTRFLLTDAE